jgi:hypothetical protein
MARGEVQSTSKEMNAHLDGRLTGPPRRVVRVTLDQ